MGLSVDVLEDVCNVMIITFSNSKQDSIFVAKDFSLITSSFVEQK